MKDADAYIRANRAGWNGIAANRDAKGPQFFRDGNSTLDDFEAGIVGDVRAKSLLHLACANGNDTLSWAVRGAHVTGVDISGVAIRIAQQTASEACPDAQFVEADVYDLPAGLGEFDIVYMSWGAICWMPDLRRWSEIVRVHLKSGGSLALFEHHPIWEVIGVGDGALTLLGDYFGREPRHIRRTDAAKRPTGATATTDLSPFVWPIGDVLGSLTSAGLRIDHFSEGPGAGMYQGLSQRAGWLPAYYAVMASRQDR